MPIFTVPQLGGSPGPAGPTGPVGTGATGPTGPQENRYFLRYTVDLGVPSGGTQYLRLGEGVFASEAGDLMTADATIRGISVDVDAVDASRAYLAEVLSDPSGAGGTGPTVEATLALPLSTLRVRDRTLSVPVTGLLDLGVRVTRTSGAGASSFSEIVVIVEVSL